MHTLTASFSTRKLAIAFVISTSFSLLISSTPIGKELGCQRPQGFDLFSPNAVKAAVNSAAKDPKVKAAVYVVTSADKFPKIMQEINENAENVQVILITVEELRNNPSSIQNAAGVLLDGQYFEGLDSTSKEYILSSLTETIKGTIKQYVCPS